MAALRPRNLGVDGLADRLVVANGPDNPVVDSCATTTSTRSPPGRPTRSPSCATTAPSARPGEVVWVDITSDPSFTVPPLTADFGTFMLLAGRLHQAGHTGADVDEVLAGQPVDDRQAASWRALGSMVLD